MTILCNIAIYKIRENQSIDEHLSYNEASPRGEVEEEEESLLSKGGGGGGGVGG